jgi:hypothetical protein
LMQMIYEIVVHEEEVDDGEKESPEIEEVEWKCLCSKENDEDANLYAHDDDMSKLLLRSSLLKW